MSELVRTTTAEVARAAVHVKINNDAIDELLQSGDAGFSKDFIASLSKVEWDACEWHYCADAASAGPMTALYVLVMDALNFCFWPCDGLEYEHLATGLKNALMADPESFSASRLKVVNEATIQSWIPGFSVPLLRERVLRVQEIGEVLEEEFRGDVLNLIRQANHDAVKLVSLMTRYFPGFRDTTIYEGRLVHFYKRAQIFVGDIWGAYGKPKDPEHPCYFPNMHRLTMFADYRIPQILRHVKILEYSEALGAAIDSKTEIPFGSHEEIEIRACSVVAVEVMREKIAQRMGFVLTSVELDWLLWNWGEQTKDGIKPHHRTLTIYY